MIIGVMLSGAAERGQNWFTIGKASFGSTPAEYLFHLIFKRSDFHGRNFYHRLVVF
jgi:hypothetical protein